MIPKDKLLHLTLSALLTIAIGIPFGLWWGVALTAIIGIAKEVIWDYALGKGCPDLADIYADLCGVAVGAVFVILM